MFVVRLRIFVDWHLAAGHDVSVVPPTDAGVAQQLADMDMARGLPASVIDCLPARERAGQTVVPVRRLQTFHDVEDLADEAAGLLREQLHALAQWGDAMHMAISELCDNALQHGENDLGVYVAADRIETPQRAFRLAIADLGIGIPEHIRARHPEWHDDTAAIVRVLQRGVTGTGDPHRGNGFSEIFDVAHETMLVRAMSEARIDIRSAKGRVIVVLSAGQQTADGGPVEAARRGTWITYTVTSV